MNSRSSNRRRRNNGLEDYMNSLSCPICGLKFGFTRRTSAQEGMIVRHITECSQNYNCSSSIDENDPKESLTNHPPDNLHHDNRNVHKKNPKSPQKKRRQGRRKVQVVATTTQPLENNHNIEAANRETEVERGQSKEEEVQKSLAEVIDSIHSSRETAAKKKIDDGDDDGDDDVVAVTTRMSPRNMEAKMAISNSPISSLLDSGRKIIVSPSSKSALTAKSELSLMGESTSSLSSSTLPTHIKLNEFDNMSTGDLFEQRENQNLCTRVNTNNVDHRHNVNLELESKHQMTSSIPNKDKSIETTIVNTEVGKDIHKKDDTSKIEKSKTNMKKRKKSRREQLHIDEKVQNHSAFDNLKERRKNDRNMMTCPVCFRTFSRLKKSLAEINSHVMMCSDAQHYEDRIRSTSYLQQSSEANSKSSKGLESLSRNKRKVTPCRKIMHEESINKITPIQGEKRTRSIHDSDDDFTKRRKHSIESFKKDCQAKRALELILLGYLSP